MVDQRNPASDHAESSPVHQQYLEIIQSIGGVVIHLDAGGQIVDGSDNLAAMSGYRLVDLRGKPLTDIVHAEWADAVRRQLSIHQDAGQSESLEYLLLRADGGDQAVRQFVLPAASDDPLTYLVLHPIKTASRPSRSETQTILAVLPEVLILHDEGTIVNVNPALEQILGYAREDAIGMSVDVFLPQSINPGILESLRENRAFPFTAVAVHQDGKYLPVEVRSAQLHYRGRDLEAITLHDISERLKQEHVVQASDQLYRTLAGNLPNAAVMVFDAELRFTVTEGDLLIRPMFEGFNIVGSLPNALPLADAEIEQIEGLMREALTGDSRFYNVAYKRRLLELHIFPVHDKENAVFAGMIVINDSTEQHSTVTALRENEQRFRGLFDNNNDAVFFVDLDGKIVDVNQRALELLLTTRDKQIGKDAQYNIEPDNREASDDIQERLFAGERIPIYRRTFRRSDGSTFPAEINVALVYDGDGNPSHYQSIVRDISDRKVIEEQLERRIEQLTTLRMVDEELSDRLDVNYVLTMGLDSCMRLSTAIAGFISMKGNDGVFRPIAVNGAYPPDQSLGDYRPDAAGIIARVVRTGRPAFLPDVTDDGDYVPLRDRTVAQIVVPLAVRDEVMGILNIESDRPGKFTEDVFDVVKLITRRIGVAVDNARLFRQTQEQLEQLRDLYEQVSHLEQLKTDMIRVAAHDLRNPLSAIIGHIELIDMDVEDNILPPSMNTHAAPIRQASERMRRIIDDILSLERIEQSVQDKEYPPIDIVALVKNTVNENLLLAEERGRDLIMDTAEYLRVMVRGDNVELHEVVNNLIENAIKYTDEDGRIAVRLKADDRDVFIEVEDNGYGIPEDKQAKLFQPFYRVQTKETSTIKGTGLGLHLVKNIIDRHKGTMIFKSVYREGSTFGFRMPRIPEDELVQ